MEPKSVGDFQKATKLFMEDFESITARIIAYSWNGSNVNLASRFILSTAPHARTRATRRYPAAPNLIQLNSSLPIKELTHVLGIFTDGWIEIQGKVITYKKCERDAFSSPPDSWFSRLSRQESLERIGLDTFAFLIEARQSVMNNMAGYEPLRELESHLSSAERPYGNLSDLVREFIGPQPYLGDVWNQSNVDVVAPLFLKLNPECGLLDKEIAYSGSVGPGHAVSDARIGLVAYDGDRAVYRRLFGIHANRHGSGQDGDGYCARIKLGKRATRLNLLLSYRREKVDSLELHSGLLGDANSRMLAQNIVDPQLNKFKEGLVGKGKGKGRGLERSVMLLFHFLGFSAVVTEPDASDAVDVLAFTYDPRVVFLVECTTDAPDLRNKLTKLSARRRLFGHGRGAARVMTILATSLAQDYVNAQDFERASKDDILILTSENLRSLLELAEGGRTPAAVRKVILEVALSRGIRDMRALL